MIIAKVQFHVLLKLSFNPACREVLFKGDFLNIIDSITELPSKVLVSYPFLTLFMLVVKNKQTNKTPVKGIFSEN